MQNGHRGPAASHAVFYSTDVQPPHLTTCCGVRWFLSNYVQDARTHCHGPCSLGVIIKKKTKKKYLILIILAVNIYSIYDEYVRIYLQARQQQSLACHL